MTDWQPIETAPKDSTSVLLVKRHEQGVAFYRDGKWRLGGQMYFDKPTHWQPLPAPPAADAT